MRIVRAAAVLLAVGLAVPAGAQIIGGPTVRVSSQPLDPMAWATTSVATLLDGDLIVVWWDERDGVFQAFGQRLDAWGHRLGTEIAVAAPTGQDPRVAATAAGGFVVVWGQGGTVQARCFDAGGAPGSIVSVGTGQFPDVASDSAGNFVVAWTESSGGSILAQRFSGACAAVGATITATPISNPNLLARVAVASAPDGRFLVAWEGTDAVNQLAVFARRYAADGTAFGPAFQVNDMVLAYLQSASMAADGGFVVAFGGAGGIWARRFDAAGTPIGPQFAVVPSPASMPDVAHTATGAFVVTWLGSDPQLGDVVAVRHFTPAGTAGPILVAGTTYLPAGLRVPAITAQPDEYVAVTWTHRDGPQEEIVLRRFGPTAAREVTFDGNGVLEPGEDVQVIPTWANGTGATATLSGVATAFDGPAGPGVTYGLLDASASYGTLADGAAAPCSATGDCYRAGVSAPAVRPAAHWDARLDEVLSFGGTVTHRWPVHVGGTFPDVPVSSAFYRFVETLVHAGVTGGCSASGYCPAASVTREQMAVFVLRSRHEGYLSWPCAGMFRRFNDVPATSAYCRWIEDLARRNVVGGCDATSYCPGAPVSRQEMAVFVLATKEASGYRPPDCGAPRFADVPASSPFCPWIEELARRGVVTGCGGGNYCPTAPVSREQMGVFLALTFGLSLSAP